MKNKIQTTIALLSVIAFVNVSMAGIPVTCLNCSNLFTQALEYIKDIEQLAEAVKQYNELVKQTENAITNTMNLPTDLKSNLTAQLKAAVDDVQRLKNYKADMDALYTIFADTWPELKDVKVEGILMTERITAKGDQFKAAAEKMDNILQANFELSGQQLQEMEDSGEFDDYMDQLLASKNGRQQAIEAGNQINSIAVNEMRQTRTLLASYIQAQSTAAAQAEHEKKLLEAEDERERNQGINREGASLPEI